MAGEFDFGNMGGEPTVRIVNPKKPGSYMNIGVSDYDENIHTLWPEQDQEQIDMIEAIASDDGHEEPEPPPPPEPTHNALGGYDSIESRKARR